jgi:hypothetical protein
VRVPRPPRGPASDVLAWVDDEPRRDRPKSSNGQQQYAVAASTNSLSCPCPDGLKGRVCKHLRAAVLVLGKRQRTWLRRTPLGRACIVVRLSHTQLLWT